MEMATTARIFTAATVFTGLIVAATPLYAQDSDALTQDTVTAYFEEMAQDITEMVEADDIEGLVEWMQDAIAEEAHFFVSMDSYVGDERRSFTILSLSSQEATELGRMALGALSQTQGEQQIIEDFTLDFQIEQVTPAGPDAATVVARITETVTLAMLEGTAGAAEAEAQETESQADRLELETISDCHMLIRRDDAGDGLLIGLSACSTELRH